MHRTRTWNMDQPVLRGRNRVLPIEGGDGSTLSLDFTTMSSLDSRFTFTRSSTATFINSSGLMQFANANLMTYSTPRSAGSAWGVVGTVTWGSATITDPVGNSSAQEVTFGTAGSAIFNTTGTTVTNGITHTFSVWMRAATGTTNVRIGNANVGAVSTVSLTTTWQRFSCQYVSSGTNDGGAIYSQTGTPSATFYVWGAQVQPGSVVGELLETTGTIRRDIPRFDYDPTTLSPRGLLVEGSAINLTRYSEELNQVSGFSYWFGTNFNTPSKSGSPTDPFNGTNAWKLIASSGSGFHGWRQIYTFTAAAYTFSFWAKAAEYDRVILSDLTSGQGGCAFVLSGSGTATVIAGTVTPTNPTIVPHQNGWYRCSVTIVMPATSPGIAIAGYPIGATTSAFGTSYTADGTSGVWITGVQTELGSGASSYIPTGSSTVQRAADDLQLTGSNFSSIWPSGLSEWSVYWSGDITRAPATTQLVWLTRAVGSSRTRGFVTTGSGIRSSSNLADLTPGLNATVNTVFKMATGFKNADCFMWAHNGTTTASASDTSSGLQTDSDRLLFNVNADNFMHIRQFKVWQSRLSNGTLQGLVS